MAHSPDEYEPLDLSADARGLNTDTRRPPGDAPGSAHAEAPGDAPGEARAQTHRQPRPTPVKPSRIDWLVVGIAIGVKMGVAGALGGYVGWNVGWQAGAKRMTQTDILGHVRQVMIDDWLVTFLAVDLGAALIGGGAIAMLAKRGPVLGALVYITICQLMQVAWPIFDGYPAWYILASVFACIPLAVAAAWVGVAIKGPGEATDR